MTASRKDPAESGTLRHYYRNWRPTLYGRIWTRIWAWATGLGLLPDIVTTLLVKERGSGRLIGHVLVPVVCEGQRYLVSMLGAGSNWVLDQRETGGAAFLKRGRTEPVTLVEVPPEQRASILKAWCQIATSGRQHLPVAHDAPIADFEAIAADYPVFRVDRA
jgi:hypothetical protein